MKKEITFRWKKGRYFCHKLNQPAHCDTVSVIRRFSSRAIKLKAIPCFYQFYCEVYILQLQRIRGHGYGRSITEIRCLRGTSECDKFELRRTAILIVNIARLYIKIMNLRGVRERNNCVDLCEDSRPTSCDSFSLFVQTIVCVRGVVLVRKIKKERWMERMIYWPETESMVIEEDYEAIG